MTLRLAQEKQPMGSPRTILLTVLLAAALGACSTPKWQLEMGLTREPEWRTDARREVRMEFQDSKPSTGKKDDDEGRSVFHVILLYIPNRFLDLFDMFRFGVEVGPGIGIDAAATDALRVGLMTRITAGVGLQTLRHVPVKLDSEGYAGLGPVDIGGKGGLPWYRDPWDVRLEVMALLVGGHAAVNIKEIGDFFVGFLTIDIADDDF
jgi:hypothetical protein